MIYNGVTDVVSNNLAFGTYVTFGPSRDPFLHNQTNTSSNLCSNSCTLKFRPIIMISVSLYHATFPNANDGEKSGNGSVSSGGPHTHNTVYHMQEHLWRAHTHVWRHGADPVPKLCRFVLRDACSSVGWVLLGV